MTQDQIQRDLHNRIAGDIVRTIVMKPMGHGGQETDVLILLESVIAGVILTIVKPGGDEVILNTIFNRLQTRLPELRETFGSELRYASGEPSAKP